MADRPRRSAGWPNRSAANQNSPQYLTVGQVRYEILERLSRQDRGRFKVRDPQPRPRGTIRLALVVEKSAAANQLRRSLFRLPGQVNNFPELIATGDYQGKHLWIVSWKPGYTLAYFWKRFEQGKVERPGVWETVRRMRSLVHALRVLHDHCQIVHGDLKPDNLLIPSDPGGLTLIDYGSSWQTERTAARSPGDGYDPWYAAPELVAPASVDGFVDGRADQFSAAIIFYQLLTSTLPFDGLGGRAGLPECRKEAVKCYRSPSELMPERGVLPRKVLRQLDDVCRRALSFNPDERFENTRAFCTALDSIWKELQLATHMSPSGVRLGFAEQTLKVIDAGLASLRRWRR